jgi:hypothetical protein
MILAPISLTSLSEAFQSLADNLLNDEAASRLSGDDPARSPQLLTEAMFRVLELLGAAEAQEIGEWDIHQLGDYGTRLLVDLAHLAGVLELHELSQEFEDLSFPLAIWLARHGGELNTLEPVVNALARKANTIREPMALEQLYELTGEIQQAVNDSMQKDLEKSSPNRPWRILLLNRAIIATRSHLPPLIEAAYDDLIAHLPEEAPGFFREGMQQMEALNYPLPVRRVVENYYNQWSSGRTLH